MKMTNAVFPPGCITLPLHAKAFTNVVVAISTLSRLSNSPGQDHHVLPFVDVEVEERI